MAAIPTMLRQPLLQAGKFTVIGVLATAVHVAAAMIAHGAFGLSPLWSNLVGFLTAVFVSYIGNWYWTFDAVSGHGFAVPRFLAVALGGFCINHAIVYVMSNRLGLPFWSAMLAVVFVVPALSFWLNRTRVFLNHRMED